MSNLDMSLQMQVYNSALAWAKRTGLSDPGRVNRAFGILKRPGALDRAVTEYSATRTECECPDRRGLICKHRLAMMMWTRVQEGKSDFLGVELPTEYPDYAAGTDLDL
ncbi:MAG: hypothetical protein ACRD1K_20510 [Acidimicrobiales bacterium]